MSDLLRANGLTVSFGDTRVVDGIDFTVPRGGTLGIVGESGSGKSMTSLAIMGLLPKGARREGSIDFDGTGLTTLSERQMRAVRGDRIAMVFQDPLSSLNPYYTVGTQIAEATARTAPGSAAGPPARRRSRRWNGCTSARPAGGWTTIRTSSPAVCASG